MIVVITGSRENVSRETVEAGLDAFMHQWRQDRATELRERSPVDIELKFRVGDAAGVDTFALEYLHRNHLDGGLVVYCASDSRARSLSLEGHTVYRASDWSTIGGRAGMIRNAAMLRGATHCIKFHDGVSPGTRHCVELAESRGLTVIDGIALGWDYSVEKRADV